MKTMNYIIVFGFLLLLSSCGGGGWSAEDKEGLKSMLGWVNEEQYDCYGEEAQKKFTSLADMETADTNGNYTKEELNEWMDMVEEKCVGE